MNTTDLLKHLDKKIEDSKKLISLGKAWERLSNNRDFKEIIVKGFFHDEAVRLVSIKGDPEMQTPERQASILQQMDSIGCLQSYLRNLDKAVSQAEKDLEDFEAEREDLLTEGDE